MLGDGNHTGGVLSACRPRRRLKNSVFGRNTSSRRASAILPGAPRIPRAPRVVRRHGFLREHMASR
jgi:hypothetical protein